MNCRLQDLYKKEVKKKLQEKYNYKNPELVPKFKKIVINSVSREVAQNGKLVKNVMDDITAITGQKPITARAKKSIASFKLREGQPIGASVTLRGKKMYDFFDRLVTLALPRVRDFRGISPKGFDGKGNFTMGIKEQIIFPEINYDKIDKVRGLGISIVTSAQTNDEGVELLSLMGMPFKKKTK